MREQSLPADKSRFFFAPYGPTAHGSRFKLLPQVQLRILTPGFDLQFMHIFRFFPKHHPPTNIQTQIQSNITYQIPFRYLKTCTTSVASDPFNMNPWGTIWTFSNYIFVFLWSGGGPHFGSLGTARRRAFNLSQTPDQSRPGKNNA